MNENERKTAEWFRKAAEAGNPEGQFNYGMCLRDGRGVRMDREQARTWLLKAADAGHRDAKQTLAEFDGKPKTGATANNPKSSSDGMKFLRWILFVATGIAIKACVAHNR